MPTRDAGSASGLLNTSQQLGQAFGIALTALVFFNMMGSNATKAVDDQKPAVTRQLMAAGVPAQQADQIFASYKRCSVDRAKEKDPSSLPASCPDPAHPDPNQPPAVGRILAAEGV